MKLKKVKFALLASLALAGCSHKNTKDEGVRVLYGPPPGYESKIIRVLYGAQPRIQEVQEEKRPQEENLQQQFLPDENAGNWDYLSQIIPEKD